MVDSSWIDMVAGLSKNCSFHTPPDFCASAGTANAAASTAASRTDAVVERSYAIAPSTS
jgi:hypothetical protein